MYEVLKSNYVKCVKVTLLNKVALSHIIELK